MSSYRMQKAVESPMYLGWYNTFNSINRIEKY